MMRVLTLAALVLSGCVEPKLVKLTFGTNGEGLDGFVCKDESGNYLLDRLSAADGGIIKASLVTDFVKLGGLPGCRTGQLISWCGSHTCAPLPTNRLCTPIDLPSRVASLSRKEVKELVREKMKNLTGHLVSVDAPDEFVMLRVIATSQPCSEVEVPASGVLPTYDKTKLVGCAYSCPTLFDRVDQDVYIGFDTLENQCEHGIRTCADNALKWAP